MQGIVGAIKDSEESDRISALVEYVYVLGEKRDRPMNKVILESEGRAAILSCSKGCPWRFTTWQHRKRGIKKKKIK